MENEEVATLILIQVLSSINQCINLHDPSAPEIADAKYMHEHLVGLKKLIESHLRPHLTRDDMNSWIDTIWDALHDNDELEKDTERWENICTAMAWISEELGVQHDMDD